MKKIGFVDYYISEWHANNYPAWIDAAGSDYKVTHVWAELDTSPLDGVTTDKWCADYGTKKCATIDELCTECDAIIILAPSNPEKHLPYAKEVFKYGKPTYIDKAFAPNLDEAKEIFALAEKYSVPFFSTSALRYADELASFFDSKNTIITGCGRNFPEYGIHMIEMAVKILGESITDTSVVCQGNHRICYLSTEGGKQATLVYAPKLPYSISGEDVDGKPIYEKVESEFFRKLLCDIVRFFDEKTVSFDIAQTLEVIRIRDELLSK